MLVVSGIARYVSLCLRGFDSCLDSLTFREWRTFSRLESSDMLPIVSMRIQEVPQWEKKTISSPHILDLRE